MTAPANGKLNRRAVLAAVLASRNDALMVTGLGTSTYDLFATSPAAENAYLWNAMGLSVPVALGLAIAQPDRRVLAVTGDGEMMMGIGSLAVVAAQAPGNLGILVLDNEVFEETGAQAGLTAARTDIAAIAQGAGFARTRVVSDLRDVEGLADFLLVEPGPALAVVKVGPSMDPPAYPTMDGAELVATFRNAVLGE